MGSWYLVHTKPSAEGIASANLERQGYEVYYPQLARIPRRDGGSKGTTAALFPRYVFVRVIQDGQSLSPIRSTLGVANVVRFGVDYAVVPAEVVRGLQERADPITGLHTLRPKLLPRGAPIRILDGALRGLEGVFDRGLGTDRVLVLLQLLGHSTSVDLSVDFIVPVHAA